MQTIDQENEQRKRLEFAVAQAALKKEGEQQVVLRNKANQKKQQVSVAFNCAINERHVPTPTAFAGSCHL